MTNLAPATPSAPASRATLILAGLTLATTALALVMVRTGNAGWLEAVSFVTGAVCVWLTVRENVWNYPIGLLNVITFSVVFYRAGLLGDAGLQVVYFVLGIIGWYMWLHGGKNRTALRVGRASTLERSIVITLVAVGTFVLWKVLHIAGGSTTFWDGLTTSMSLGAQWLINRKKLESWIGWIIVDIIYVPLYIYKDLHLTAILYGVFLVMAVMGFLQWRATWRVQQVNSLPA
jgi:nicotinamide mononucleotide transporter